jgi:hypothetical protein
MAVFGSIESETEDRIHRAFRRLLILFVSGALFGGAFLALSQPPVQLQNIALLLFRLQDPVWLITASVLVSGLYVVWRKGALNRSLRLPQIHPWTLALLTLLVCTVGTAWLTTEFPLSMDEFVLTFGAEMLSEGHFIGSFDAEWRPYLQALQPLYIYADAQTLTWTTVYKPGMHLILAFMSLFGITAYTNAVLTALSVGLVAVLARRLWPDDRAAPIIAAGLLALTPQFLFTGMTQYAMPAHLALNLAWVCLFLNDTRTSHLAALALGALATALHQVNVHPTFVAPFMIALLLDRRWRLVAFYGIGYLAILAFSMVWYDIAYWIEGVTPAAADQLFPENLLAQIFVQHSRMDLVLWPVNFFRFLSWQSLATLLLILIALPVMKSAPRTVRLLGWGVLVSLLPYLLFTPSPGHGWGYRYLHPLLGSLSIIAVYGWLSLSRLQRGPIQALLVALAALGALTALPLKAFQVWAFTQPYATAVTAVQSTQADIVLVDIFDIHMGQDLVRNDPFLARRPRVMALQSLSPAQVRVLCDRYDVALFHHGDLEHTGIPTGREPRAERADGHWTQPHSLRQAGCGLAPDETG